MTEIDENIKLGELSQWATHFEWRYVSEHYKPCLTLDFGCGYGFSDIYLAMAGFTIVGYDIDKDRIKTARYILGKQTDDIRHRVSFHDSGIPIRAYELVWISHVLEHIPIDQWHYRFELIRYACGLTDTPILISVPLGHAYDMLEHVNHWTSPEELLRDLGSTMDAKWRAWVDNENLVIKAVNHD